MNRIAIGALHVMERHAGAVDALVYMILGFVGDAIEGAEGALRIATNDACPNRRPNHDCRR